MNLTTYQSSFLQKFLGKNYKYFAIFQYFAKSTTSGLYGFLLGQFSDIIQNLSIAHIWILNNASPQIITYLIIGRTYKAISDTFFLEFLVGCQAFFVRDKRNFSGIHRAYNGISGVLSGILIPLDKLPFYNFIQFLPTSWLLHHPMQIYLGKYSQLQTFWVFAGGIIWCLVLYFLAKFVFKKDLKKNESVGL